MRSYTPYKTAGLFVLLIAVLLFGTSLTYRATTRIADSEQWVTHTYGVLAALDSLSFTLENAQTNANDFIATGKEEYLSAYRTAASRILPRLDAIRTLTSDNPEQQQAIAAVQTKSLQLKDFLDNAMEYRLEGSLSQPTGEQLHAIIQDLAAMKARESDLLAQRSNQAAANLRTTRAGLLAGCVINCILLVFAALLISRDQQQRADVKDSRLRLAAIVDNSDDAIIGKKLDGTITSWNAGAERQYGYKAEEMIGGTIFKIVPAGRRDELRMILEKVGRGERVEHLETRRLRRDGTQIEVELIISPVKDDRGVLIGASAIGRDITARKQMERSLHQLSVRILRAQDEERRRIAREIHDTTVQKLALLSMNLAQLKRPLNAASTASTLESSQSLTTECVQELRTLSYVLHPPMLDELGLASALKIYVEGIAQRSGIRITTEIDPDIKRLDPDVEMALFRVAQESLSNVLRHSGSKTARIRLSNHDGVELAIIDEGKGMSNRQPESDVPVGIGVGIAGMNERINQLGGILTIDSGPKGTTVTARVPGERVMNA